MLHILRETGKSLKIHQDVNQGSNVFEDIDLSKAPKTSRHSTDDFQIDSPFGKLKEKKDNAQPTKIKTSGSTFKNPINQTDKKVWELIKESVALDTSFGDAHISNKHCNFFVNKNNASFEDMNKLIEFVKTSVEKKTGIVLEKEIKILK